MLIARLARMSSPLLSGPAAKQTSVGASSRCAAELCWVARLSQMPGHPGPVVATFSRHRQSKTAQWPARPDHRPAGCIGSRFRDGVAIFPDRHGRDAEFRDKQGNGFRGPVERRTSRRDQVPTTKSRNRIWLRAVTRSRALLALAFHGIALDLVTLSFPAATPTSTASINPLRKLALELKRAIRLHAAAGLAVWD